MKIFRTEMNNAEVFELMVAVRKEYPGWALNCYQKMVISQ